jgi:coenzyme F420-0:L-glutamate ligase/coenzyme F420-1:gamma-L-glutamate ligase
VDLHVFPVLGLPDVAAGDDIARSIVEAIESGGIAGRRIEKGDIFVVAQKIVSKAEDAVVRLDDVEPSAFAREWAAAHAKDPRAIEVVLRESRRIVRMDRGVLISETHHGFVCANAGVDASNVRSRW